VPRTALNFTAILAHAAWRLALFGFAKNRKIRA
jgi:hypothetical protein